MLEQAVDGLKGFDSSFASAPTDAYISDYVEGSGFSIISETQGNELKKEQTLDVIRAAVEGLENYVNLEEADCYEVPEITSENEELKALLEKMQKYAGISITYTFGENKEVLDGPTISSWLHVDGFEVELDTAQVENYVATLRKKYDTIFRPRTFMTSYGQEVTIDGGDYGWWMNYDKEAEELEAMIEKGESGERTPVYYQTAASYGTPDYGTTYVEINLTAQHRFFYQDGKLMMESDFVSGNSAKGYDTPAGVYSITYKQRDATLTGENYQTPVSYWMPFNKNIGMHDANWRSSFGGTIYKTKGSHGCINMPPAKIPMRVKALRSIKNRYQLPRHCLVIVTCMAAFLVGRRNMSASLKGMWGRLKYRLCFQMIKRFSFLIFCQRHGRQQKMRRSNKVQALQSMVLVLWDC